jgi:hypothetical protein
MMKRTIVALAVAAFAFANTTAAQENATIVLRSGERLSGQLMDMGGSGFTARINGQERQIPTNDVAVIDFTGGGISQGDLDRLSGGPFVVLKDGQVLNGQLTDIGGSSPLRLSFSMNGQNRDLTSNDVAKIVLARPNDALTTNPPTTAGTTGTIGTDSINVPGQQQWTATGITVRRGERLNINASGEVKIGGGGNMTAPPSGAGETNQGNPVPTAPTGALIGRIGNGTPFAIGTQNSIVAPAAGQLFLGVNDSYVGDNQGSFQVHVQRVGR